MICLVLMYKCIFCRATVSIKQCRGDPLVNNPVCLCQWESPLAVMEWKEIWSIYPTGAVRVQ